MAVSRSCSTLVIIVALFVFQVPLSAFVLATQLDDEEVQPHDWSQIERFAERFGAGAHDWLDWDAAYSELGPSLIALYERHGWDTEPDLFSLELILDVGAIPPWRINDRLNRFTELAAERYLLDEDQEIYLRDLAVREAGYLLAHHATDMIPIAIEALQTWTAGEPFTSEQIARWTAASEPVFATARERYDLAAREFIDELDPAQQTLAHADLSAANRRLDRVAEMRAAALRGEWDPADWGLPPEAADTSWPALGEGDVVLPDSTAAPNAIDAELAQSQSGLASESKTQTARDDDPWARYVRAFISHYQMTDSQRKEAWRYYDRVRDRRARIEGQAARRVRELRSARADDEELDDRVALLEGARDTQVDRLFDLLKRRLERLLTRAQRRAAERLGLPFEYKQKSAE